MSLQHLGQPAQGWEVFQRALKSIPAYQHFIAEHGLRGDNVSWQDIPRLTKSNYIKVYPLAELEDPTQSDTVTYFRSSGASGKSTYWPYTRHILGNVAESQRPWFEANFGIHQGKTLVLVAFTGGGWLARELMTWVFRHYAQREDYDLQLIVPENDPEELCRVIDLMGDRYDSILVCTMPFIVRNMISVAREQQIDFPANKLHFYISGEPFDESWRTSLRETFGQSCRVAATYGATDVGAIGFESRASVALRQLLHANTDLAKRLDMAGPIPGLYHASSIAGYLEVLNDSLAITRWQGIPLVRYDLGDKVCFLSWEDTKQAVSQWMVDADPSDEAKQLYNFITTSRPGLTDLIVLEGRAEEGQQLLGTFISRVTLESVLAPLLDQYNLTGAYRCDIHRDADGEGLQITLEFNGSPKIYHGADDTTLSALIHEGLGRYDSLWTDMVRESYTKRGLDELLACRVSCVAYPELSRSETKQTKVNRIQ